MTAEVFECSKTEFSILVPFIVLEKSIARLRIDIEAYLINVGYDHFYCEWDDLKFINKWFTKFTLKFRGEKAPTKTAIEAMLRLLWKGELDDCERNKRG